MSSGLSFSELGSQNRLSSSVISIWGALQIKKLSSIFLINLKENTIRFTYVVDIKQVDSIQQSHNTLIALPVYQTQPINFLRLHVFSPNAEVVTHYCSLNMEIEPWQEEIQILLYNKNRLIYRGKKKWHTWYSSVVSSAATISFVNGRYSYSRLIHW